MTKDMEGVNRQLTCSHAKFTLCYGNLTLLAFGTSRGGVFDVVGGRFRHGGRVFSSSRCVGSLSQIMNGCVCTIQFTMSMEKDLKGFE